MTRGPHCRKLRYTLYYSILNRSYNWCYEEILPRKISNAIPIWWNTNFSKTLRIFSHGYFRKSCLRFNLVLQKFSKRKPKFLHENKINKYPIKGIWQLLRSHVKFDFHTVDSAPGCKMKRAALMSASLKNLPWGHFLRV